MSESSAYKKIGMVARWRPVHRGHAPVLDALCNCSEQVLIGIGSSNRYNFRNPFTLEETIDMLHLQLASKDNYAIIPVPDLDDGPRWRIMVIEMFGPLDCFVTANPYVASLLTQNYTITHPVSFVPQTERIPVDGQMVRREMARGNGWKELVPKAVMHYITENQLDERFRREFGLQTLALDTIL